MNLFHLFVHIFLILLFFQQVMSRNSFASCSVLKIMIFYILRFKKSSDTKNGVLKYLSYTKSIFYYVDRIKIFVESQ